MLVASIARRTLDLKRHSIRKRYRFTEAEACGYDHRLRRPGCQGGEKEIQQDLHHLLFPGG